MNGKVFGISILTIILVLVALVVGKKFGAQLPLIKSL